MSAEEQQQVIEETNERCYFTIIPNMVDDMDLSLLAYRLYGHIKRRAGESEGGKCFETVRHMAEACKMSKTTLTRAKKELVEAGLILIAERETPHGHFTGHDIFILDIWRANMDKCSPVPKEGTGPVPKEGIKEEPLIKNNQREKNTPIATGVYYTPSAANKERLPSQAQSDIPSSFYTSEDEDRYLRSIETMFSRHSPAVITDEQRKKLIKAHRRHKDGKVTRKGEVYTLTLAQLYEATAKNALYGREWCDQTMHRIINGAKNWRVEFPRMTLRDWENRIRADLETYSGGEDEYTGY